MTDTTTAEQATAFLRQVVTCQESGYFCMAVSNGAGGWLEEWFRWPDDLDNGRIIDKAFRQAPHANVYFSSYIFKAPQSTKENVLPTRTIQADLDDADLKDLPIQPTALVETSPGRHQAYWVLAPPTRDQKGNVVATGAPLPLEEHESLSRKMTYSIKLCDRSGWPLGKKVRIPGTLNHKYLSGPKPVKIIAVHNIEHQADTIEALPDVPRFLVEHFDDGFIETPNEVDTHPLELLKRIEADVPVSVWTKYDVVQSDRSEALWALMMWAFKAGLNRNEVFTLAKGSANNKFRDLKSRADQDLAKDVLRAEHAAKSNATDPRQVIRDVYRKPLNKIERCRTMFDIVLQTLREQGEFVRSREDMGWYIRRDIGRPVPVTPRSEQLTILLDTQFGLNMTEGETKYVAQGLYTYTMSLPQTAFESTLSYYDPVQRHLLIHTGRDTVIRVTPTSIEKATDGAYGVIFPWVGNVEPFTPSISASAHANLTNYDWADELFDEGARGYGSSIRNIMNMSPTQAKALLKVWLMFILFRNVAQTKPIIACLGQPGSGKTTAMRRVYRLLYGRYKSLSDLTSRDDFDLMTARDPLVVLDNIDTWERWLPDRLATSASVADIERRKLYTDGGVYLVRRQAFVGVTAHNPKFGREDVADRFLLFSFKRFEKFESEVQILEDISRQRSRLWTAIIRDAQRILNTPVPNDPREIPQFRLEDFAKYGLWIARGLNVEAAFKSSIEDVKSAQSAFTLEEEAMLVNAVIALSNRKGRKPDEPMTSSQLWTQLEAHVSDARQFVAIYRNPVQLAKKVSAMQPALSKVVDIRRSMLGPSIMWTIMPRTHTTAT